MSTQLSKYLDEMRKRHARLSMRQMAIGAGIGESLVYGIIKDGRGARPETLKALADTWGTPDDYRELMRLAGHPLPANAGLDPEQQAVARQYGLVPDEVKKRVWRILREAPDEHPDLDEIAGREFIESFKLTELIEIVASLSPEERERWMIETFLLALKRRREAESDGENRSSP